MSSSIDGVYFKQQVKAAGYTLDEFAQELGIGRTTFYYYRTGARPIPHQLRKHIEDLLQCPFQDFLLPHQESNLILLARDELRRTS